MPSIEGESSPRRSSTMVVGQVTVYVPPNPPEAVVFAGDGQLVAPWGGVLEAADVPSDDDRRCTPGG